MPAMAAGLMLWYEAEMGYNGSPPVDCPHFPPSIAALPSMLSRSQLFLFLIGCGLGLGFRDSPLAYGDETPSPLSIDFEDQVLPLLEVHCLDCHDSSTREAELDLSTFKRMSDVTDHYQIWETILQRVEAGEMPPADASPELDDTGRAVLVQWIRSMRDSEAQRNAGDPGPVLARRLSNAEYDYSIRDLTGVDIRPTSTFPVDPANEAGFDNSGESLSMSPALVNKYLEAARQVTEHLVLAPSGIRFAPHPVVTDTDRDKYCVKRIVEFYERQPTDIGDYFFAAWLHQQRLKENAQAADLVKLADELNLSRRYLEEIWTVLHDPLVKLGPLNHVQSMWNELPVSDAETDGAKEQCEKIEVYVKAARKLYEFQFENLEVPEIHNGAQAFVLWKNKRYATHRRQANLSNVQKLNAEEAGNVNLAGVRPPNDDSYAQYVDDCRKFCNIFPDAFYISERGRDYLGTPKEKQEKGRLLSAGFHSMMGYFRDDEPLYDLILNEHQQAELDELWRELDFVAAAPMRQYQGFLWFERTDSRFMRDPEFDFARPEDLAALREPVIRELASVYRAKAIRNSAEGDAIEAIDQYFEEINAQIRWVEDARKASEARHVDDLMEFASRAFRRPLGATEEQGLREFYRQLREGDESGRSLNHSQRADA